jgi:glutaconate CoA-transferase, subunit A
MFSMVQAGSMGVPFVAVRGLMGSNILNHRPDLRIVDNPFLEKEPVVVAQPIRPDVSVFHAVKADRWGNALTPGGMRDDLMMARASRWVVVTAEEVVDKELKDENRKVSTFLPAIDVDQVVHAPWGAHPGNCGFLYGHDEAHLREYIEASKEESTFCDYLDKYVYRLKDHAEYVSRLGLDARKN